MRRLVLFVFLFSVSAVQARVTTDLDAGWISRDPEIPYVWMSAHPRVEGWPEPGQTVTWRAHVRNWSTTSRNVEVRWLLDGEVVSSGNVTFAANGFTTVDLPAAMAPVMMKRRGDVMSRDHS